MRNNDSLEDRSEPREPYECPMMALAYSENFQAVEPEEGDTQLDAIVLPELRVW